MTEFNYEDVENFFKDIIEDLVLNYNFSLFLNDPRAEILLYWKRDNNVPYLKVSNGISKGVFIINFDYGDEWVMKIPFCDKMYDYCALEVQNYTLAKQDGLENFFAETFSLGSFLNAEVYLMRRADVDYDELESYSTNEGCSEYYCNDSDYIYPDVLSCLDGFYNCDKVERLVNFCTNWEINDIHGENIGFYKDGTPVIIDYSGFDG